MAFPTRPIRVIERDVETGEPQRAGNGEDQRRKPAEAFELMQVPEIKDQARRDTEIDEIGERIELRPETGRAAQRPREAPVEPVENRGDNDDKNRDLELPFDGKTDARQAHRKRQQCHEVGQDDAQRHRPDAPPAHESEPALALPRLASMHRKSSRQRIAHRRLLKANRGTAETSLILALGHLEETRRLVGVEISQDGLARNRGRAFCHQRPRAMRQIDIDARTKADQAETLARINAVTLFDEADNAPGDKAGNLNDANPALRRYR